MNKGAARSLLVLVAFAAAGCRTTPKEDPALSAHAAAGACDDGPGKAHTASVSSAPASASSAGGKGHDEECGKSQTVKTYGRTLGDTPIVEVSRVLDEPDTFADKTVVVHGRVRAACTRKGCWMEIAPSMAAESQGSRVTFQDYGFFVPTTSAGKHARVQGVVSTKRVPPEEVAHMESEGGHFSKKLSDGSAREVRIVATGVELYDDG